MAKTILAAAVDAAYDYIKARVTGIAVCDTQPTNYTEAFTTFNLAKVGLTSTGLTTAAGDAGGSARKMTTDQKTGVSVLVTGAAKFIALFGSTASVLLLVTTCTSQTITTGNTLTIPAFKHEFGDVT
jgi:hypothetical protein